MKSCFYIFELILIIVFFKKGQKRTIKQNIIENSETGLSKNIFHHPLLIIRDLLKFSSKTGPKINPIASGSFGKLAKKKDSLKN